MENILKYSKENEVHFFKKIEELTDANQFSSCIKMLESIPNEERDYQISYQLVRAYQNFAIIGDDEKGTDYVLGTLFLKLSLDILKSIKAEGEHKAEWNMRMAYGYQYLENQEELAIIYAHRWAALDPSDECAFEVIEQCNEELENRKIQGETIWKK